MNKMSIVMGMAVMLFGCESLYEPSSIDSIRSQRQVEAYNATVSAEEDKLVCTREKPLGSNIPRFFCVTVAQRDRMSREAQENIQLIGGAGSNVVN